MMNIAQSARKNLPAIILLLAWVSIQLLLFFTRGINTSLESEKYIHAADTLINNGQLPGIRYVFYLATTLLIAFCKILGFGYTGVVVMQLCLNLVATATFYFTLRKIAGNYLPAFIATLGLIVFIDYQSWNFYLYTESVFFSFLLLFFCFCVRTDVPARRDIIIQLILLTACIISRPLGLLLLPCWMIYLFLHSRSKTKWIIGTVSFVAVLLFVYFSNLLLSSINDYYVLLPAEYGLVICELPRVKTADLSYLKSLSPIQQLVQYAIDFPGTFFKLALLRMKVFFFLTRDYYSALHNIYLLAYAVILYFPTLLYLTLGKNRKRLIFPLSIILFFTLAIAFQCDDFHNRFHNAILPVFIFAGIFLFTDNLNRKRIVHSRL